VQLRGVRYTSESSFHGVYYTAQSSCILHRGVGKKSELSEFQIVKKSVPKEQNRAKQYFSVTSAV